MNVFLRRMAVLGILTTLAEHLLPQGGLRKAGRLVMGLMMMMTVLTSLLEVISLPLPDVGGLARFQYQQELAMNHDPGSYRDAVMESLRRQVEDAARRAAGEMGLTGIGVRAALSQDGRITGIVLTPEAVAASALEGAGAEYEALGERVAQALSIPKDLVWVEAGGGAR